MALVHFALLVPGWRCASMLAACWASIIGQAPGPFSWAASFYADGDAETWEALAGLPRDERIAHRYFGRRNLGAAHARRVMLRDVGDAEAVCLLLDMDDELEPRALARIAAEYQRGAWATYGSMTGHPRPAYPAEVVARRAYRMHRYLATAPRTFRRWLADGVPEDYLKDAGGRWLMAATDIALMLSVLERCPPGRAVHIAEPLYRIGRHPQGTATRFGADYKASIRRHLAALAPLPALEERHAAALG